MRAEQEEQTSFAIGKVVEIESEYDLLVRYITENIFLHHGISDSLIFKINDNPLV